MKILLLISVLTVVTIGACTNRNGNASNTDIYIDPENPPIAKFDTLFHDFGTLVQGESVSHTFKFINQGKSDLIIYDAYSTCGCTVPQYTKEPLKYNAEGKLEVIFNSEGKRGVQYKMVNLKLNTPSGEKSIGIRANVIKK